MIAYCVVWIHIINTKPFTTMKTNCIMKAVALLLMLAAASVVSAQQAVPIDEEHFPDEGFRAYVQARFTPETIPTITQFSIQDNPTPPWYNIKDIRGIEYFSSLEELSVGTCGITHLDVSGLASLKDLGIGNLSSLVSLTANGLPNLCTLTTSICNSLVSVSVSDNPNLRTLSLGRTPYLQDLAIERNSSLSKLSVGRVTNDNQQVSDYAENIDLSTCTALDSVSLYGFRTDMG